MKYELIGVEMKKLTFELIKRGDLIYYEGPVLSHFVDEFGREYLMSWKEMDDEANRWLLFHVSTAELHKYLSAKLSLYSLIRKTESGTVFFLDIDDEAEIKSIKCVEIAAIPTAYLPGRDSYFEIEYATYYARHLAENLKTILKNEKRPQDDFLETAATQLFGVNSHEHSVITHNSSCFRAISDHRFRNLYTHSLINFPLLLHVHANMRFSYQNIDLPWYVSTFNRDITIDDLIDFFNVNATNALRNFNEAEFTAVLEKILDSTIIIVQTHPEQYESLYNSWKRVVKKEIEEINTIERLLESKI